MDRNPLDEQNESKRFSPALPTHPSLGSTVFTVLRKKAFRRVAVSAVSLAVVTTVLYSARSLAYFTDTSASKGNRIEAGIVNIDLVEMMDDGNGGLTSYTDPVQVLPSATVSKVVSVKNTGDLPVYIRIKLEKTVNDESGLPANWQDKISCNLNLTDWTLLDGYYYYNRALEAGQTTEPLFSEVTFAASMGNEFVNKTLQFTVTSQATQVYENGGNALDAVGWPAES